MKKRKKIMDKIFEMIPGTYFIGLFKEGGDIIDAFSIVDELEEELTIGASQNIIDAIKRAIEIRSSKVFGNIDEILMRTENALMYIIFGRDNDRIVAVFNKNTPIGRVKSVLKKQTEKF